MPIDNKSNNTHLKLLLGHHKPNITYQTLMIIRLIFTTNRQEHESFTATAGDSISSKAPSRYQESLTASSDTILATNRHCHSHSYLTSHRCCCSSLQDSSLLVIIPQPPCLILPPRHRPKAFFFPPPKPFICIFSLHSLIFMVPCILFPSLRHFLARFLLLSLSILCRVPSYFL